jgi:hypothetical protein
LASTNESTRRQNPEEHHHHHPHRRENLKAYILLVFERLNEFSSYLIFKMSIPQTSACDIRQKGGCYSCNPCNRNRGLIRDNDVRHLSIYLKILSVEEAVGT